MWELSMNIEAMAFPPATANMHKTGPEIIIGLRLVCYNSVLRAKAEIVLCFYTIFCYCCHRCKDRAEAHWLTCGFNTIVFASPSGVWGGAGGTHWILPLQLPLHAHLTLSPGISYTPSLPIVKACARWFFSRAVCASPYATGPLVHPVTDLNKEPAASKK